MSDIHYVKAVDVEEWAALCGKFKQERDEAIRQRNETNESSAFSCNFYYEEKLKAERERNDAQDMVEKLTEQGLKLMDDNRILKREIKKLKKKYE